MKNKKEKSNIVAARQKPDGISKRGLKIIIAGVLILITGFFVLTKTDPGGQNWASKLSPFLILGGYIIIGAGILTPDKPLPQPDKM
jgi:hypothetical protein